MTARGLSRLAGAALLLAPVAAGGAKTAEAPSGCESVASFGGFDTRPATSEPDRAHAFRNWLCQSAIEDETDLATAAAGLGLAAEGLANALGYSPRTQGFAAWKLGFCGDKRAADRAGDYVTSILPGVGAMLRHCADEPGLHARLETTANRCEFLVRLSHSSPPDPPKDLRVIATDSHLTCTPKSTGAVLNLAQPVDLLCRRRGEDGVVVMIDAPSAGIGRLDRMMELPALRAAPKEMAAEKEVFGGEYEITIGWRGRDGHYVPPTIDIWRVQSGAGACRVSGNGNPYTPRSTWFTQATATCSPEEIRFTGYRGLDPTTKTSSWFTLTLRSNDSGNTFSGGGQDSLGNVIVSATAKRRGGGGGGGGGIGGVVGAATPAVSGPCKP